MRGRPFPVGWMKAITTTTIQKTTIVGNRYLKFARGPIDTTVISIIAGVYINLYHACMSTGPVYTTGSVFDAMGSCESHFTGIPRNTSVYGLISHLALIELCLQFAVVELELFGIYI